MAKANKNSQGEWVDPRLKPHPTKKGGIFRAVWRIPISIVEMLLTIVIGGGVLAVKEVARLILVVAAICAGATVLWWVLVSVWYWIRATYIG